MPADSLQPHERKVSVLVRECPERTLFLKEELGAGQTDGADGPIDYTVDLPIPPGCILVAVKNGSQARQFTIRLTELVGATFEAIDAGIETPEREEADDAT